MRRLNWRWLVLLGILSSALLHGTLCDDSHKMKENTNKSYRDVFSPRMDYDQWKPLGRGDPLKDDPTFDYVPPVLDRVHYWIDPASRKPDTQTQDKHKTEILLLGISSKKSSNGVNFAESKKDDFYDNFKFMDAPKFNNQRVSKPFNTGYYQFHNYRRNTYSKGRIPYTILVPPPISYNKLNTNGTPPNPTNNFTPTTTEYQTTSIPDVTIQSSNLIHFSSSTEEFNKIKATPTLNLLVPNKIRNNNFKERKPAEFEFNRAHFNHSGKPLQEAGSDHNIKVIAVPFGGKVEIMHKGQVSDDKLDILNTYVKIGKTEAQVHASDDVVSITPDNMENLMVFPHPMENMQPPPVTMNPIFTSQPEKDNDIFPPQTTSFLETTTEHFPTTTSSSLTTDPLFKHYKQSMEPIKGPLYLIIQGHSKVKTYGPSKSFHGIALQESLNELPINDEKYEVEHLHNKIEEEGKFREGRSGKLQTLKHVIQTGLGAINSSDLYNDLNDFQETEVRAGFEIITGEITTEKYHKGIVEAARKLDLNEIEKKN